VFKDATCGAGEEPKTKLSCVKLAICPDHPRRYKPLKFCMRGRVRQIVIYFKFHENRGMILGAVGSKIALSHWFGQWLRPTTSCTTIRTCRDYRYHDIL